MYTSTFKYRANKKEEIDTRIVCVCVNYLYFLLCRYLYYCITLLFMHKKINTKNAIYFNVFKCPNCEIKQKLCWQKKMIN